MLKLRKPRRKRPSQAEYLNTKRGCLAVVIIKLSEALHVPLINAPGKPSRHPWHQSRTGKQIESQI